MVGRSGSRRLERRGAAEGSAPGGKAAGRGGAGRHRRRSAATTASTANKAKGAAKGAKNGGKAAAKNEAKNAAKNAGTNATKSKQGAVEKIETYKPSKEDVEEDTKLVEENPEQTGENYIKAQQNLPEVIVVGGEEEGSVLGSELPPGVEP